MLLLISRRRSIPIHVLDEVKAASAGFNDESSLMLLEESSLIALGNVSRAAATWLARFADSPAGVQTQDRWNTQRVSVPAIVKARKCHMAVDSVNREPLWD